MTFQKLSKETLKIALEYREEYGDKQQTAIDLLRGHKYIPKIKGRIRHLGVVERNCSPAAIKYLYEVAESK